MVTFSTQIMLEIHIFLFICNRSEHKLLCLHKEQPSTSMYYGSRFSTANWRSEFPCFNQYYSGFGHRVCCGPVTALWENYCMIWDRCRECKMFSVSLERYLRNYDSSFSGVCRAGGGDWLHRGKERETCISLSVRRVDIVVPLNFCDMFIYYLFQKLWKR